MLPNPLSRIKRRTAVIAAGAAVLVAVGGGTTAAFAAGTDGPTTSPSASASCTPHLGAVLRAAPAKLKDDLKTLRTAPKDQRAKDREEIRAKALSGAYGGRVERISRIVAPGKNGAAVKALPQALQDDLKHLRTTTKPKTDERKAAAAAIVTSAQQGKYGSAVQQRVQQRQDRCEAKKTK